MTWSDANCYVGGETADYDRSDLAWEIDNHDGDIDGVVAVAVASAADADAAAVGGDDVAVVAADASEQYFESCCPACG